MISIIVAASTNNVIGSQGELPWRLSDDLRRFKAITMGKPIIMGRKTYQSIGRALPGRQNIVITRQADFVAEGCGVVGSKEAALGGSQVYALFHPDAGRLYLTRVHAEVEGDAHFPDVASDDWRLVADEPHRADERNEYDYSFMTYERQC